MLEWLLKKIGVSDETVAHLDQAHLAFQYPAVLWVGLLLLIPISYFIFYRQKMNLGTVPTRYRILLSVTRVLILVILVLVLSGPYLEIDYEREKKPIFAVLLDRSQSMRLPAGPFESEEEQLQFARGLGLSISEGKLTDQARQKLTKMTRAELAQSALQAAGAGLIEPLHEQYDVRFYTFDRQLTTAAISPTNTVKTPEDAGSTPGAATHIGTALASLLEDAAGRRISGVLLLSDGQNTGGHSPSEAAQAAADASAPVFPMVVGSTRRVTDVSIVDVHTSGLVAVGDTVRVAATIESHGFKPGRPVKIELRSGETLLDSKEIGLNPAEQQQIELTFQAKSAGIQALTVVAPPLPEETKVLHGNNSSAAFVRVSDEKLKVLYLDGRPSWTFRFLKNAMKRDHGLAGLGDETPDIVVETQWRLAPKEQQAKTLPAGIKELSKYHVVVLGDVSPELLGAGFRKLLLEAVRDKGVGLVVAAGPQFMPHGFDTDFRDLLPVRLGGQPGIEAPAYKPFRLEATPSGLIHEAMRMYDDPGRNQQVWRSMPDYFWSAAAVRPAPAATVLAFNPGVEGPFGKSPLIAHHYAGQGRVMFIGTDSTWLWRRYVGDRFFYKFWGQSIRFVARRDEDEQMKNRIEVRPLRAQIGEQAEIELMAFTADKTPHRESRMPVSVLGAGKMETIELSADPTKPGRYTGRFTPAELGDFRVVYQPYDGTSSVESPLHVMAATEEYRYPHVNRIALQSLAAASGGKVLGPDQLKSLPDRLEGEIVVDQMYHEASIWDNWLVLLIVIVAYSMDVGVRRLTGLT